MASQMPKVTKDLTTQMQMLMQPNANWEEFLTPAPLCIAIMGELVFISSGTDFPINKNPPKDGFKYIKYPESFRACLEQVCDSGWQAFNIAHKHMDHIRFHTASVSGHTKPAEKIPCGLYVTDAGVQTDERREKLLSNELKSIHTIAVECVKLASSVKKRFNGVICLVKELLGACISAKHVKGEDLPAVQSKIKENRLREQSEKELDEKFTKAKEDMEKQVARPKEELKLMAKAQANAGQQSAGQQASENARLRIEQSREQLKQCREEYNKAVERMEANQKELTDILVEMQNCKIQEIDLDTTIEMLVKVMDAMGRVEEQWEKMAHYFQMVADNDKSSLEKTMKKFGQRVEDVQTLSYNDKLFNKDLLYNQAFQASDITSLFHMISEIYYKVSNKYLMDRVSILGELMTMDKDKPEFLQERQKLQNSCKEAQDSILKLILKNKKEFEKNTDAIMKQIDGELKAVLPAADPEETKRM